MRLFTKLLHSTVSMATETAAANYKIEANQFQRLILTLGSGLTAIFDPSRDDMISAFGELTGSYALPRIHRRMLSDPEGSLILQQRPLISSKTIDLQALERLPVNTFGHQYVKFLRQNDITPDSRKSVQFVDDPDLAYVILRYRQIHDFTHCILGMRTNMLGEVTVKIFEAIQLDLPMCWLAGLFGVLRLGPKHTEKYMNHHLEWVIENAKRSRPLINVYFEKHFETPIDELRAQLNLTTLSQTSTDINSISRSEAQEVVKQPN